MPFKAMDISGEKYGRLTAIKRVANRKRATFWLFRCECGTETEINLGSVRSGITKSCGCLDREKSAERKRTHGMKGTRAYNVWCSMKARCLNPRQKSYRHYGGRGITVCPRWVESFENFIEDMGQPPEGFSLDRIDPDGNYDPSNCRWADMRTQRANQRGTVLYPYEGENLPIAEIARRSGANYENLFYRIAKAKQNPEEAVRLALSGKWRRA